MKEKIRMKTFLSLLIAICMGNSVFGQRSLEADQRVWDAFEPDIIEFWIENHPDSIHYYNFICQNGFHFIKTEFLQGTDKHIVTETVDLQNQLTLIKDGKSLKDFNFLLLDKKYRTYKENPQIFKVIGADMYLKLPSHSYISDKFKGYRQFMSNSN